MDGKQVLQWMGRRFCNGWEVSNGWEGFILGTGSPVTWSDSGMG